MDEENLPEDEPGQMPQIVLPPFEPGRPCPKCQAEGAQPRHHEIPVLIVFGQGSPWPCAGLDGRLGEHMCTKCESCGFAWMEGAPSGMGVASAYPP